jgi:MFS transporter, FHS family, L-fucose permease
MNDFKQSTSHRSALYTLMSVWFFWGFIAASNGILIPMFKEQFQLQQWESQLVDFAFYAAYFVGSILYLLISVFTGGDILNRIGYRQGIMYGFLISAVGTLLFIPAASQHSFFLLLTGLFVVGLGFSLQQTSTQPFMIALGDPATGAQRINLGGAVNNFGTTIGPVIISYVLFGTVTDAAPEGVGIEAVKVPFLVIGAIFLLFALFFRFSNLPTITNDEDIEIGTGVLKYPQLVLGMIAIFCYVGAEVTIGSNLGEYLKQTQNLDSSRISEYVSLFWGSMMMGRWTAALANFNFSKAVKNLLTILTPFVAFGVVLFVNSLRGTDVTPLYIYAIAVFVLIAAYFLSQERPVRTMLIFAGGGIIAMLIGIFTTGQLALFSLISGGLFCSVLWPCIFSLGTAGLGKYTNQGSAYLIMMILGGAVVPVIQGRLADSIGIGLSYVAPLVCFAYLFYFGLIAKRVLLKQGLDFDRDVAMKAGH